MRLEANRDAWDRLSKAAWKVRNNARLARTGITRVGAAVLCPNAETYAGCNVQHQFRSPDIHAEVSAIASMVAAGERRFLAILVVADRERFSPCGGCRDWIMEMGGPEAVVGFQRNPSDPPQIWSAADLLPDYPG